MYRFRVLAFPCLSSPGARIDGYSTIMLLVDRFAPSFYSALTPLGPIVWDSSKKGVRSLSLVHIYLQAQLTRCHGTRDKASDSKPFANKFHGTTVKTEPTWDIETVQGHQTHETAQLMRGSHAIGQNPTEPSIEWGSHNASRNAAQRAERNGTPIRLGRA